MSALTKELPQCLLTAGVLNVRKIMRTYVPITDLIDAEVEQRIDRAKKFADAVEAIYEVDRDLSFWCGRIRWALKRKATYATNAWSLRGNVSPQYLKALSDRLPGFKVDLSYD